MKKILLKITCFLLFLCLCFPAYLKAQTPAKVTIRGKVIDSKDKSTIPSASVAEIDKDDRIITNTPTDIDGNFALRVTDVKNRIQVSFIGYKNFVEPINGRTVINVSLVSTATDLSEVVIAAKPTVNNGTGLNIDTRNSTMATATISAKALEELSATSIDQAL